MKKPATMITVFFLLLVAAGHLCRLIAQIEVVVNGVAIPQWPSIFGVVVPAGLALMLKRESGK